MDSPPPPNCRVYLKGVPPLLLKKDEIARHWEAVTGCYPHSVVISGGLTRNGGETSVSLCVSMDMRKIPREFLMRRSIILVEIKPLYSQKICNIPPEANDEDVFKAIKHSLADDLKFEVDYCSKGTACVHFELQNDLNEFLSWVQKKVILVMCEKVQIFNSNNNNNIIIGKPELSDSGDRGIQMKEILAKDENEIPEFGNSQKRISRESSIIEEKQVEVIQQQTGKIDCQSDDTNVDLVLGLPVENQSQKPSSFPIIEATEKRGSKRKHNPTRIIEIINATKFKDPNKTGVLWIYPQNSKNITLQFIAINWSLFYPYYKIDQDQPHILDRTIREKFQPSKCKQDRTNPNSESEWREVDWNQMIAMYDMTDQEISFSYDTIYTYLSWWKEIENQNPPPAKKKKKIPRILSPPIYLLL